MLDLCKVANQLKYFDTCRDGNDYCCRCETCSSERLLCLYSVFMGRTTFTPNPTVRFLLTLISMWNILTTIPFFMNMYNLVNNNVNLSPSHRLP